ncbi:MAG: UDP-galactopyranose mutase Glf [Rhodobacteraceae bacterium HLUCCA08]|nr:MAG: UDP-galactopyranose mutase Glf [Rhodobacteraceae bacterium HLUCCA08]
MAVDRVIVAGAGLSGAVLARELAEAGLGVTVFESRDHVAGNCHTARDPETGVLVHVYGPHIFHTDDAEVWDYVNAHARFMPYRHTVRTTVGDRVFSLPVNLATINALFGLDMTPDEAEAFVRARTVQPDGPPRTFEEQALAMIGPELYEAFFKGYTQKQWGVHPRDLPAAILKRLPVRFTADDSYFPHRFEGIPKDGYTAMVASILDHPGVDLHLSTPFDGDPDAAHLVYTGPLDAYFGHRLGRLGYRTLDFEHHRAEGRVQDCAVMNFGDVDVPQTRITEHKHFAPWERHDRTVWTRERARDCGPDDIPYYPIRLVREKALLADYVALARSETGVTFAGRLGTYRYLDMDRCIREALDCARAILAARRDGAPMPVFSAPPLG